MYEKMSVVSVLQAFYNLLIYFMFLYPGVQIVKKTFQLCVIFILFWLYDPCKSLILAPVLQEQHKTHP